MLHATERFNANTLRKEKNHVKKLVSLHRELIENLTHTLL